MNTIVLTGLESGFNKADAKQWLSLHTPITWNDFLLDQAIEYFHEGEVIFIYKTNLDDQKNKLRLNNLFTYYVIGDIPSITGKLLVKQNSNTFSFDLVAGEWLNINTYIDCKINELTNNGITTVKFRNKTTVFSINNGPITFTHKILSMIDTHSEFEEWEEDDI